MRFVTAPILFGPLTLAQVTYRLHMAYLKSPMRR